MQTRTIDLAMTKVAALPEEAQEEIGQEDQLRGANMLYSLEPTGHADATPLQIATTKILGIESRNWRTRQKL